MNPIAFIGGYIAWHYSAALADILRVWGNMMWFTFHFFSTGRLVTTLFSPWQRMQEEYPKKGTFDIEYFLGTLAVNIIMRLVGFIVRVIFIAASLMLAAIGLLGGVLFMAFWLVAPAAVVYLFMIGLNLTAL